MEYWPSKTQEMKQGWIIKYWLWFGKSIVDMTVLDQIDDFIKDELDVIGIHTIGM